jgi:hypothetical protein
VWLDDDRCGRMCVNIRIYARTQWTQRPFKILSFSHTFLSFIIRFIISYIFTNLDPDPLRFFHFHKLGSTSFGFFLVSQDLLRVPTCKQSKKVYRVIVTLSRETGIGFVYIISD